MKKSVERTKHILPLYFMRMELDEDVLDGRLEDAVVRQPPPPTDK